MANGKLYKISYKVAQSCFDKDGNLINKRVEEILDSFRDFSYSKKLISYSAFLKALKFGIARRTALVESSIELAESDMDKIIRSLDKSWQIINSEFTKNPDVLGGLRIKIGDYLIDASVRRKLYSIKEGN